MNKITINTGLSPSNQQKEVYRTLRTNIEFSGVENRVIVVTSCAPNDGKSTVACNLAASFASNGKKTLLVDADLRKSVLQVRLDLQSDGPMNGLSHLLSGQLPVGEIVYATNRQNLFMIPTGVFSTNPTELLGNARMEKLMEALKKLFEYIIIDTPPLGSCIDAAVVARICDGSVLVMSANNTSRSAANSMATQLKSANSNILGVVLNKVEMHKNGYYGKRYGGYYGEYYGKGSKKHA
ncbi:MAG: CpsD/CapB family tyrosine-protein kinase [Lachnospiraceae bacterium]|nr:CpsD/CapB family tyrosine-protein kinase [Lachnospiraceae bacterium]